VTINTDRTRELNINRLIQHAAKTASLLSVYQSAPDAMLSFGRDCLGLILDAMQAEGIRARAVEFETLTLVAGQSAYPLDDDVIDVVGVAMYVDPDEADVDHAAGEIPIIPVSREQWQINAAKDATGRPLQMYCHRTSSPPELRFWPTPTSDDLGTVRMQIHRLAADSDDGAKTVDMERYWGLFIVYALARELAAANALGLARVSYYGGVADSYLQKCKSYSAQKTRSQLRLSHRTGWSR
jgi:hypothetical protein